MRNYCKCLRTTAHQLKQKSRGFQAWRRLGSKHTRVMKKVESKPRKPTQASSSLLQEITHNRSLMHTHTELILCSKMMLPPLIEPLLTRPCPILPAFCLRGRNRGWESVTWLLPIHVNRPYLNLGKKWEGEKDRERTCVLTQQRQPAVQVIDWAIDPYTEPTGRHRSTIQLSTPTKWMSAVEQRTLCSSSGLVSNDFKGEIRLAKL